jgi:hypothetical protein
MVNQQPQIPPQPDPNFNPQVAPSQNQQPQYVIMQQSLRGVGGWLLFFVIIFGLSTLGYLGMFGNALDGGSDGAKRVLDLIMTPLMAIGFLTCVVLISMQKRLAVPVVWVTLGISALYNSITSILGADSHAVGGTIIGIVIQFILYGLVGLYFYQARRVKETLIR